MSSIINTAWDNPNSSIAKGIFTCCISPIKLMVLADRRGQKLNELSERIKYAF